MCCPGNRPSVVASGQPLPTSAHLPASVQAPTRPLPSWRSAPGNTISLSGCLNAGQPLRARREQHSAASQVVCQVQVVDGDGQRSVETGDL